MVNNHYIEIFEKLILLPHETEWLEFKVDNSSPEMIGEKISAISNGASIKNKPFGYLVFGVEDKTNKIVGTIFNPLLTKKGNEDLEHWLSQRLSPRIDFQINLFEYKQKKIVLFEIPANVNEPVKFKNIGYIRIGSITRKLNDFPEKERKIWNKNLNLNFEDNIAMKNVSSEAVLELLNFMAYYELTGQKMSFNQNSIIEKFIQEDYIEKENNTFNIKNLGAILFAKDLENFENLRRKVIRVIIYRGKGRLETLKEFQSKKGFATGFDELVNYINDQLPVNEEIGTSFRKEIRMYPKIAIRELVANALIHQDFSIRGTSVMVEIFSERVEITNPGKPLIDTLRFIDHNPISRNEKIAAFMRRINLCEERGTGIDKVITECELYQLPAPKFQGDEDFTKVFLYAPREFKEMDRIDRIRASYQHCCLKYVTNEAMTNQTLRERFKIDSQNYPMVSKIIKDAIEKGLIKEFDPENKAKRYTKYIPFWA
jgi:predicted HTH transcriptional regulator